MKQLESRIWARGPGSSLYELKEQGQISRQTFPSGPKLEYCTCEAQCLWVIVIEFQYWKGFKRSSVKAFCLPQALHSISSDETRSF